MAPRGPGAATVKAPAVAFGTPFRVTPWLEAGRALIAPGPTIVLGEGGELADRLEYGMEDGHLTGPLRRAERRIGEADARERSRIEAAFDLADLRLYLLEARLKIERRNHPLDGGRP